MTNDLFYFSAAVALISTVMVITRANAVHALLYLIVSLFALATIFYALGAPFVAALELIVYAGAIMVLFVFVVMMLNRSRRPTERERRVARSPHLDRTVDAGWHTRGAIGLLVLAGRPGLIFRCVGGEPKQVGVALFGPYLTGQWSSRRSCCWPDWSERSTWVGVSRLPTARRRPVTTQYRMEHGLILPAALFVLGLAGVLVRRNVMFMLMSIEIMLNAAGLAFVAGRRAVAAGGRSSDVSVHPGDGGGRGLCGLGIGAAILPRRRHARLRRRKQNARLRCGRSLAHSVLSPWPGSCSWPLSGKRCGRAVVAAVGTGSVALSAVVTAIRLAVRFLVSPPPDRPMRKQILWTWIDTGGFTTVVWVSTWTRSRF